MKKRLAFQASRDVRHTVIRVITAHLNGTAPVSWCGLNFDFADAVFDGGDFSGAEFSGGTVNFAGTEFSGAGVNFFLRVCWRLQALGVASCSASRLPLAGRSRDVAATVQVSPCW